MSAPQPERIVIVGASLAGLRGAEALRREGLTGSLTIVGDEPHEPYDRPPLSKAALTDWVPPEHTDLPWLAGLGEVDWRLGVAATALDRRAREVVLADGTRLPYDRVLIATGVRNRPWPHAGQAALEGVRGIRTREDSRVIRDLLDAGPQRVLVVGAGFTGSEVASICRQRGLEVTVVERAENPLVGPLGGVVGDVAAGLQRAAGVDLRCNVTVEALEGSGGRFRAASLSDGTTVEAGLAVIALGALRNTEWLANSGLAVGPLGVSCDPGGRAYAVNGMAVDDVFAAGDVARFPHALYGYEFLALEHWENAVVGGQVAAHNMICDSPDRRAYVSVPIFWSVQFGTNIKSVGVPTLADQILVTQGSAKEGRFAAADLEDSEEATKRRQEGLIALFGYLGELIKKHRAHPDGSMLSGLANDHRPEALGDTDLQVTGVLLLVAGHETTVNLITNGTLTLLRNTDALARLRREPGWAVPVVEELLRFEPPVQYLPNRTALADITIAGTTIPKGSLMVLLLAAASRDPGRFAHPDRFDPDRPDNQHLGFGSGVHYCFGAPLALLEVQLALAALARRLDNPRLVEDPPPYRPSPVLRGPRHLRVAYDARRAP